MRARPALRSRAELEADLAAARSGYRNWGKWGDDDVLGTLNFIDEEKRCAAAGLVRHGRTFSLSQEFNSAGPQNGFRGRVNPLHLMMESGLDAAAEAQGFDHGFGGADDMVVMPLQASTQWDGLGHIFDQKRAWNGRPCDQVVTGAGDSLTGIEKTAARFVSRGVLLDVGRALSDTGELEDGYPISTADLLRTIDNQGVSAAVGRGDIVLIRTGQLARCRRRGSWGGYANGDAPGLSFGTLGWLHSTEIAAVASDTWGLEVRPYEYEAPCFSPLHQIAIPNIGLSLGEMFDLEALAADCLADGVYEFLFVGGPLPVTGAVGAPVNPIAMK